MKKDLISDKRRPATAGDVQPCSQPSDQAERPTAKNFGDKRVAASQPQPGSGKLGARRTKSTVVEQVQNETYGSFSDESGSEETQRPSSSRHPGRIKNLAGVWATQSDETRVVRKKRLQVDETVIAEPALDDETEPHLGVIRATDRKPAGADRQIEIDEGYTKNIASLFQNRRQDETQAKKAPFEIYDDGSGGGGNAAEQAGSGNNSADVSSAGPPTSNKLRRRIKDMAGTFATLSRDDTEQNDNDNSGSKTGLTGPFRGPSGSGDPATTGGRARGTTLTDRWNQQRLLQEQEAAAERGSSGVVTATDADGRVKPAWLIELEAAKEMEPVVFENEPEVRDDVIHADDDQPDVISARSTRKMRQLWSTIEQDEMKKKEEEARAQQQLLLAKAAAARRQAEEEELAAKKLAEEAEMAAKKLAEEKELAARKEAEEKAVAAKKQAEDKALAAKKQAKEKELAVQKEAEEKALAATLAAAAAVDARASAANGDGDEEDEERDEDNDDENEDAKTTDIETLRNAQKRNRVTDELSREYVPPNYFRQQGDENVESPSGIILSGAALVHIPRRKTSGEFRAGFELMSS